MCLVFAQSTPRQKLQNGCWITLSLGYGRRFQIAIPVKTRSANESNYADCTLHLHFETILHYSSVIHNCSQIILTYLYDIDCNLMIQKGDVQVF